MAAQVPATTGSRHVLGDLVFRAYVFTSAISDGDTCVIPQNRIEAISWLSSNTAIGITASNTNPGSAQATLTFHSTGTWTGQIGVFSREG